MKENLWNKPGIPHKGYTWLGVQDLEDAVGECEMCGRGGLRYVHEVSHVLLDETMWVGCNCAELMCEDYVPGVKERALINCQKRKRNFMVRKWTPLCRDSVTWEPTVWRMCYRGVELMMSKKKNSETGYVVSAWKGKHNSLKSSADALPEAKGLAFDMAEQIRRETSE